MGVDREILFLQRAELFKQLDSVLWPLAVAKHGPSQLQEWTEILGYQHGEGVGWIQQFGTQNWKGIIDGPYGMCNGHSQLFKHTSVIFKLSKAICHHIVQ